MKAVLSRVPLDLGKVRPGDLDRQILRVSIIAELDAVNLYEQMAALAQDEAVRRVLLEVAREEKTHVGEFLALLLKLDTEQAGELEKGRAEVEELTGR